MKFYGPYLSIATLQCTRCHQYVWLQRPIKVKHFEKMAIAQLRQALTSIDLAKQPLLFFATYLLLILHYTTVQINALSTYRSTPYNTLRFPAWRYSTSSVEYRRTWTILFFVSRFFGIRERQRTRRSYPLKMFRLSSDVHAMTGL